MKLKKYKGGRFKKSDVMFDKDKHEYWLCDKQLFGITDRIAELLGIDFSNVPEQVLERARLSGSLIHDEIDNYYKSDISGFTLELHNFIKKQKELEFKVLETEFTVSDNSTTATNIDVVMDFNGLTLCDVKSTAKLDKEYVGWQLSTNAYLFEIQTGYKVENLKVYWTREDVFLDIPRISNDKVKLLIDGEIGDLKAERLPMDDKTKEQFITLQTQIREHKDAIKELEKQEQVFKDAIIKEMKKNNIKSVDMGEVLITHVEPSSRKSIDSARLKKEEPEMYSRFVKTINTKEYLKITIRGSTHE